MMTLKKYPAEKNSNNAYGHEGRSVFKIYTKKYKSKSSDSIFTIIGTTEPDLTKSMAYLLHFSEDFLHGFLNLFSIPTNYLSVFVSAEHQSNNGKTTIRRDISLKLTYKTHYVLLVVEAKCLTNANVGVTDIKNQLESYFDKNNYDDCKELDPCNMIGITLTKNKIIFSQLGTEPSALDIKSITWTDVVNLVSEVTEKIKDTTQKKFLLGFSEEISNMNATYYFEKEIFSPPAGKTINLIKELGIYCCPTDRNIRKSIYLMPRIPLIVYKEVLEKQEKALNEKIPDGVGVFPYIYKIQEVFIVGKDNLDTIEDSELKNKIKKWMKGDEVPKDLMCFLLENCLEFSKPKYTDRQNNSYSSYYQLSEILGENIL